MPSGASKRLETCSSASLRRPAGPAQGPRDIKFVDYFPCALSVRGREALLRECEPAGVIWDGGAGP